MKRQKTSIKLFFIKRCNTFSFSDVKFGRANN